MAIELIHDDNEPLIPLDTSSFAASLSDNTNEFPVSTIESPRHDANGTGDGFGVPDTGPSLVEKQKKRVKMSRKMQKMMDGFRDQVADIPIMWFHNQAKENPEWELDAKEKEVLTDAFAVVFEVLDIEIQIEALSMTLTSIWWVIAYPFVAFTFLFLTKKAAVAEKTQGESE